MANNYQQVMPEKELPCTKEEAEEIVQALEVDEDDDHHGFEFDWEGGHGYLLANESGNWDELPEAALKLVGKLIAAQGWPFLEFGVAWTCDRMRVGNFGGTKFRILPDGTLEHPQMLWPAELKFLKESGNAK